MSSTWHQAVEDYVNMRRSLGFKLAKAMATLQDFAAFLEDNGASHITIALALRWAQQNPAARPVEWPQRLSLVRGFARHWSANDSGTEIPPWRLLPHRPSRARSYIYSDDEVQRLLAAAQQLPPAGGLRGSTYYCLLAACGATSHFPTWYVPNFDHSASIQMRMSGVWTWLSRAFGRVKTDEALNNA